MAGLIPFNHNGFRMAGIDEFNNLLDDFFSDTWKSRRNLVHDTFKVDVQEDDTKYTIEADLPGVNKEEINLELNDGRLTISIIREVSKSEEEKSYLHRERCYSSMQRSVYLNAANDENIEAKLADGVLKIFISKIAPVSKVKKIQIN